jgi:hypothetical protein
MHAWQGIGYALDVTVTVDGQVRYRGTTSEISHKVEQLFAWLGMVCPLTPGSAIGLGTILDCTGLDHDDFINPGVNTAISFERLGKLRCRFAKPVQNYSPVVGRCGQLQKNSKAELQPTRKARLEITAWRPL